MGRDELLQPSEDLVSSACKKICDLRDSELMKGARHDIQKGLSPKSGKALSGRFMRELGMSTAVKGSMVPLLLTP